MERRSVVDGKVAVTAANWAVSFVCAPELAGHAAVLAEGVDADGAFVYVFADIAKGDPLADYRIYNVYADLGGGADAVTEVRCHVRRHEPDDRVKHIASTWWTKTWCVRSDDAQTMVAAIEAQARACKELKQQLDSVHRDPDTTPQHKMAEMRRIAAQFPPYELLGSQSVLARAGGHSCVTWAVDVLKISNADVFDKALNRVKAVGPFHAATFRLLSWWPFAAQSH